MSTSHPQDDDPNPTSGSSSADLPDLLPARMLNEFVYCPRLFYLEYVQGQFVDSADTIEGRQQHKRVDKETGELPDPTGEAEEPSDEPRVARSIMLSAPQAGLIARCDLVEAIDERVTPVDYKRGSLPDHLPARAWDADLVQLAAQAIILRENGHTCDEGVIYYCASKTRVTVPIDDELIAQTISARDGARRLAAAGQIPPPLVDSPKCPGCSLVGICLPDETHAITALEAGARPGPVRRLTPARDEPMPVYIQAFHGTVGKSGEQLTITAKGQPRRIVRLLDVSQLNILGNIQVSTQAIRELAKRGIPICYFSFGGRFQAITLGMTHKNVELRIRQYDTAREAQAALQFARNFITGKVHNCRTLLRRNSSPPPRRALSDLSELRRRIRDADSAATLLGLEGNAARIYFQHFAAMLKPQADQGTAFDFTTRNRRPPRDPVNALLSFAYSMLVKELTATALRVGFDPFLGLYHRPKYGRPALALDLAEEFRPLIADSVVLQVLNTGEIQASHFLQRGPACSLTPAGRRNFLNAFERRLDSLVTHPIFGYTISYRRILEVQARLLAACLAGEFPEYVPFTTR
jgi:CRISPR-associated protein Cas1